MPSENGVRAAVTRQIFRPGEGPCGDVLVLVFLRGGMDGLHLFPPHADPEYFRQRPTLAPPSPGNSGGALDLDGFFGLHPIASPLADIYRAGQMAVIHACGGPDQTLSHFEAGRALERGVAESASASSGWVSRHLAAHNIGNSSAARAVAFSNVLPAVLEGAPNPAVIRSLSDLRLHVPMAWEATYQTVLAQMYADGADLISASGRQALSLVRDHARLRVEQYRPQGSAAYPIDSFGRSMIQVAQLIKAEVGLEVAVVELGGWDSHIQQLRQLDAPMRSLAQSLGAFATDLGERLRRVVVVVLSEFGRRVGENSGHGTDHGRAGAMIVLGGEVRGGRVYGSWPGIGVDQTDPVGNLRVTTDYRSVLSELVERRLKNRNLSSVFPAFSPSVLDVFPPKP